MTFMRAFLVFVIALAAYPNFIAAQESDCAPLLRGGVFDRTEALSISERIESTKFYLCRQSVSTVSEAQQFSVNAEIPVADFLAPFGLKADQSNFRQAKDSFCQSDTRFLAQRNDLRLAFSRVNQGLVDAYTRCIALKVGMHGRIEVTSDPEQFSLSLLYRSTGEPFETRIRSSEISPLGVSCRPELRPGNLIGPGGTTLNCNRNKTQSVLVTINADHGTVRLALPVVTVADKPEPRIQAIKPVENGYGMRWESQKPSPETLVRAVGPTSIGVGVTPFVPACARASEGWSLIRKTIKISPLKVSQGCFVLCPENNGDASTTKSPTSAAECKGDQHEREICFLVRMSVNRGESCNIDWTITGDEIEK